MKHLNIYLKESLEDLTADILQWCLDKGNDIDDITMEYDTTLEDRFGISLDKREKNMLAALMHYAHSPLFPGGKPTGRSVLEFMKKLSGRRMTKFIGCGSEGIAFDAGDYVIKLITNGDRVTMNNIRKWAAAKNLKVIAPIIRHDPDFKWIATQKVITPCPEGQVIQNAISNLFTPDRRDWKSSNIDAAKTRIGEDNWKWVSRWLDDFCDDYRTICGKGASISDDLRAANIGKTKGGKIVCFDWNDPYCDNTYTAEEDLNSLLAKIQEVKALMAAAKASKKR